MFFVWEFSIGSCGVFGCIHESSQWIANPSASTYASSLLSPAMHAFPLCSSTNLVSRVTALVSPVATITALVSPALVLLVVVLRGVVLRVPLQFFAVVEIFAFGLDELIRFAAREAGEDVFGEGVVFGDAWVLGEGH